MDYTQSTATGKLGVIILLLGIIAPELSLPLVFILYALATIIFFIEDLADGYILQSMLRTVVYAIMLYSTIFIYYGIFSFVGNVLLKK